MTYQLTTHKTPAYLHVQVTGTNSVKTVIDYIHDIGDLCQEQNCSMILIEENLQGHGLSMFDIVKVIKGLRNSPPVLRWVVYVDVNPAHDPVLMDFARELAIRRGLRVRICHSVKDAKEWIASMLVLR